MLADYDHVDIAIDALNGLLKMAESLATVPSPQSPAPNPQSPVPSPQSPVPSPQSPVPSHLPFTKNGKEYTKEITGAVSTVMIKGEEIKVIIGDDQEYYFPSDQNNPSFENGVRVRAIARLSFTSFYLTREDFAQLNKCLPKLKTKHSILWRSYNGPVFHLLNCVAILDDSHTNDQVTVKKHRGNNYIASYKEYRLESFGDRNTGLWRKSVGDDGLPVYRPCFDWGVTRHILEEIILNQLVNYEQAYAVYCRLINRAIAEKSATREQLRSWWNTLWDLVKEDSQPISA